MTIREAREADRARVLGLAQQFWRESPYRAVLPAVTRTTLRRVWDAVRTHGVVLVAEPAPSELVGFLALVAVPHPLTGERYAEEVAWWVAPRARGRGAGLALLARAEAWATARGLAGLRMVAPEGSAVGRLYERLGYQAVERTYYRRLPAARTGQPARTGVGAA